MGDFLMPPRPLSLPQGLCHFQQQDPPQQLHQPHRDGAAAAGRGPGPDGGALPGAQDQAGALPAAARVREGCHRCECPLLVPRRFRHLLPLHSGQDRGRKACVLPCEPRGLCWKPHRTAGRSTACVSAAEPVWLRPGLLGPGPGPTQPSPCLRHTLEAATLPCSFCPSPPCPLPPAPACLHQERE